VDLVTIPMIILAFSSISFSNLNLGCINWQVSNLFLQPKPYLHSSLCLKGQSGYFLQRSPSLQSFKGIFCGLRALGAGYGAGGTGGAGGGW